MCARAPISSKRLAFALISGHEAKSTSPPQIKEQGRLAHSLASLLVSADVSFFVGQVSFDLDTAVMFFCFVMILHSAVNLQHNPQHKTAYAAQHSPVRRCVACKSLVATVSQLPGHRTRAASRDALTSLDATQSAVLI